MKLSPAAAQTPLPRPTDPAILRLVRALARQAARDDHEQETKELQHNVRR
jgi:hypothetical protein